MAVEDFTAYTESDPGSEITVTSTKVSWASMARDVDSWVVDDKGVDHFDGDFTHLVETQLTADGSTGLGTFWAIANAIDTWDDIDAAGGSQLLAFFYGTGPAIYIREIDSGTQYSDTSVNLSAGTTYYLEIERDESVGTHGTLYCRIYSDSGRTTLVDTLSIALHSSKKDFRYIYACQNLNTGDSGASRESTAFSQNLDLQEAGGVSVAPRLTLMGVG